MLVGVAAFEARFQFWHERWYTSALFPVCDADKEQFNGPAKRRTYTH